MKSTTGILGRTLIAGVAGLTVACSGGATGTDSPAISVESGEEFETRLVNREYPYTMSDGALLVCAEWEVISADGEMLGIRREAYPVQTMNRHLRNVGTSEAVSHVDASFRSALLAKGIRRIESCADAREYARIDRERPQLGTVPEQALPALAQSDAFPREDLQVGQGGESFDKIINGHSFDHPSTVGFAINGGSRCTGQLIGPFAMLTSAHCALPPGQIEIQVWIQPAGGTQRCVSHAVPGNCPAFTGTPNAVSLVHPNYDLNVSFDQAVIVISGGWSAPANTEARWTRFASNWGMPVVASVNAEPIRIVGYGHNTVNGTGGNVGRRGNTTHTISSVNSTLTSFGILRSTSTSSGTCKGDSGGGAHNTTMLGGPNITMGIHFGPTAAVNDTCVAPGAEMIYSIPDGQFVSNIVTFFGGSCTTFAHSSGAPYMKCW